MERRTGEVLTTVIPIITLTLLAVAFFAFLLLQVRKRYSRRLPSAAGGKVPPVDLAAFRNLTDPAEEAFLRAQLPSEEFRRIQRLRLRAAMLYVNALSQNVAALMQVGQAARLQSDPQIAASGQAIMSCALRLKVRCLATECKLAVAILLPTVFSFSGVLADRYRHVADLANSLHVEHAA
jgi:hypothetical protein